MRVILIGITLAAIFLQGCSVVSDSAKSKRSIPEKTLRAENTSGLATTTMADAKLERLQEQEKMLMLQLSLMSDQMSGDERQAAMLDLILGYEDFIAQNPNYALGYVLYGKLLRRLDRPEQANNLFVRANQIDPNIPSVKQQIGNFLAEKGVFELALPYFVSAIELAPDVAIYHYQLGELLFMFRAAYLSEKILTRATLDAQMLEAFEKACSFAPQNRDFRLRYAEAFFDIENADWNKALSLWNELELDARSDREQDVIRLQRARVFLEMGRFENAQSLLNSVQRPALEEARQQLLERIRHSLNST